MQCRPNQAVLAVGFDALILCQQLCQPCFGLPMGAEPCGNVPRRPLLLETCKQRRLEYKPVSFLPAI